MEIHNLTHLVSCKEMQRGEKKSERGERWEAMRDTVKEHTEDMDQQRDQCVGKPDDSSNIRSVTLPSSTVKSLFCLC